MKKQSKNLEKAIVLVLMLNVIGYTNVMAAELDGTGNNGIVDVPVHGSFNYIYGSKVYEKDSEANNSCVGNVTITNKENNIEIKNAVAGSYAFSENKNAFSGEGNITINGGKYNLEKTVWNDNFCGIFGSYAHSTSGEAKAINGKININNVSELDIVDGILANGIYGSFADVGYDKIANNTIAVADGGSVTIISSSVSAPIAGSFARFERSGNAEVNATNGIVNILSDSNIKSDIYGCLTEGRNGKWSTSNGVVNIIGENINVKSTDIAGTYSDGLGTPIDSSISTNGIVNIEGANVKAKYITGSYLNTPYQGEKTSTSSYGQVNIENAIVDVSNGGIYGASCGGSSGTGGKVETINSCVTISNSEITGDVIGGDATSYDIFTKEDNVEFRATSKNNSVILIGQNKLDNIYASIIINNKGIAEALDNKVILKDGVNVTYDDSDIYGYDSSFTSEDNIIAKNNNLIVDNWSGTVKSINNFNNVEFKNIQWENGGIVLGLLENGENSLKDTVISLTGSTVINNGTKLQVGDYMYFINHDNDVNLGTDSNNVKCDDNNIFTSGVAVEGKGAVEVEADGDVKYTITEVGTTDQAKATTDYNSVAAAFLIYGSDLVVDGLNAMEQDQLFGVKTFAIVEGVDKTFEVADDLKVNGWNGLYGVGNIKKTDDGVLSYAAFFENGTANYRVYNSFMDEAFRGNGSIVYNGGGIAGRYKKDGGVYAEASVRAGMLKNQMKDIFRDGNGNAYGYDTENPYWALHVGTGKIYDVGENKDLDVYARYYHTYNDGDSFMAAGDRFDVDSITSNRLRLGMRYNTNKDKKWQTYYGAAYEYEFSGDSKVHINDDTLVKESMKGSSCFAEIGFNYQRYKKSSWDFEGRLRGYVGETKGISGMLRVNYSF